MPDIRLIFYFILFYFCIKGTHKKKIIKTIYQIDIAINIPHVHGKLRNKNEYI
jgi:hypothetical protein